MDSEIKNIPYWARIVSFEERKKSVLVLQETLENKKFLDKLINRQNTHKI